MFKWLCFLKIVLYFGLIIYHLTDIYFDWRGYNELVSVDEDFSAIPNNDKAAGIFFLASCISGTLLSVLMVLVYCYYIRYHRSLMSPYIYSTDCNNRVVVSELTISFFELIFKDGIQSSLAFIAYDTGPVKSCISTATRGFIICSVIGNSKLLVCFVTKLWGFGAGEEVESASKSLLCGLGSVGSLIFLFFTSLYFSKIQDVSTCGAV